MQRRHGAALAAFIAMATGWSAGLPAWGRDLGPRPPGQFDYYVLTLTWVPSFCATHRDPRECGRGLTFALHGLWPENENGDYPSNCSHEALTPALISENQGIYASPTLIKHEWSKHGTCSGLAPGDYFKLSDEDAKRVVIPEAYRTPVALKKKQAKTVAADFVAANPGLPADGVTVVAAGSRIGEIRFCVTRDGAFRSCKPQ